MFKKRRKLSVTLYVIIGKSCKIAVIRYIAQQDTGNNSLTFFTDAHQYIN